MDTQKTHHLFKTQHLFFVMMLFPQPLNETRSLYETSRNSKQYGMYVYYILYNYILFLSKCVEGSKKAIGLYLTSDNSGEVLMYFDLN